MTRRLQILVDSTYILPAFGIEVKGSHGQRPREAGQAMSVWQGHFLLHEHHLDRSNTQGSLRV